MPRTLPPGWEKVLDAGSGQYYFYNARQGVTQWDPPDTGATRATATFTTVTTTRKPKAGYTPRPVVNHNASFRQPVAYAHRSPRAARQTTVRTTTRQKRRGGGGGVGGTGCGCECSGVSCTGGDWIFTGTLLGVVILVIALTSSFGNGTGANGMSNRNDYNTYRSRASTTSGNAAAATGATAVVSGCVAGYDDVATTSQCGLLGEVLKLVNEHRASMNDAAVKPLKANALLNAAAQRHACWMADETTMSHTGGPADSDKEFVDRVKKTGYQVSFVLVTTRPSPLSHLSHELHQSKYPSDPPRTQKHTECEMLA
jgi:hypothetical protein